MAGAVNDRIVNVPNVLTLVRILLTPFIAYAILEENAFLALGLMAAAGLSDMVDGAIARHFDQRTTVGAYLDPLADKLMLVSAFVTLFIIGVVPLYLFLAVIFRDVIIIVGAIAYELVTRKLHMAPSLLSKATTFSQIIYVLFVLAAMAWTLPPPWVEVAAWFTFALTCASGLHYLVAWTFKAAREAR